MKAKKGVAPRLLQLCAGSGLEKVRLADKVVSANKEVIIDRNGREDEEVDKWLKSMNKN